VFIIKRCSSLEEEEEKGTLYCSLYADILEIWNISILWIWYTCLDLWSYDWLANDPFNIQKCIINSVWLYNAIL
jgi:hypothetical protein